MNWKMIFKYFLVLLTGSTILLVYLAHHNTIRIYGGKTEMVVHTAFVTEEVPLCIQNVSVLSEDGSTFIPNQVVCIDNGTISSVDSIRRNPGNGLVIDGEGKFLIPGLIDSHVHLFKSPNDLLLYVANGITGIREMIGEEEHLAWRKEITAGRTGPDMYIASPRLGSFGRMEGWFMKYTQGFNNIRDAGEAASFVKKYSDLGYDAVKIYSHLNKESYEAINTYAAEANMDVVGHIPWSMDISGIMASNQSEIAHLEELMNAIRREFGKFDTPEGAADFEAYVDKRSKEIALELKATNISVTTTLWLTQSFVRQKFELDEVLREVALIYENPGISEWDKRIPGGLGWLPEINRYKLPGDLNAEEKAWQKVFWSAYGRSCSIILKNLSEAGASIMAGTDANLPPAVPGFSLHDELVAMQKAGMSNAGILRSATDVPAQWMGSKAGRIAGGYKANLLLLERNPLEDIANTKSIDMVILNGKVLDKALLNRMLESVKQANDNSRRMDISPFLEKR